MVGNGGETVETAVEELNHGWPRKMSGRATSRSQRHNLVAQRINLRYLAFLSLLLLISIESAEQVSFEHRCDGFNDNKADFHVNLSLIELGKCLGVASDLKKDRNMVGSRIKWRNRTSEYEKAAPIVIVPQRASYCDFTLSNQVSRRDTNRLDYFRVTAFDVNGDDHLPGNASYGDGGGTSDHGVVGPRVQQERGDVNDATHGGDITSTPQVPVGILENNGRDGGEILAGELDHRRDDGGRGVGDCEDGRGLVVVGWREKLWVWLALWKII